MGTALRSFALLVALALSAQAAEDILIADFEGEKQASLGHQPVALSIQTSIEPIEGKVKLQVLVDRTSIEVFGADGRFSMSSCFLPPSGNKKISLSAKGGTAQVKSLEVWELKSAWPE